MGRKIKPTQPSLIVSFFKDLLYYGMEFVGKFYSKYPGIVVDTDDPENLNRLKLMIPDITGEDYHDYWAFPSNCFSGDGYGSQMLPRKGDVVWVEFEKGNPSKPIWSHGFRAKGEAPKDIRFLRKENTWLITPNGTTIIIDEYSNSIDIKLPGNKSGITIRDKSISIINPSMISLGNDEKSKYSAVLGELLLESVESLDDSYNNLITSLKADITASTLAGSPLLLYAKTKAAIDKIILDRAKFKNKLKDILSKRNTLE